MNILVVGNSHIAKILSRKLSESKKNKIFATVECENVKFVDINSSNFEKLTEFAKDNKIELVIPTDFKIIESNFTHHMTQEGLSVFSPLEGASLITSSKSFLKKYLYKNKIPTPKFTICEKPQMAYDFIQNTNYPIVIKPDCHSELLSTEVAETYAHAKKILIRFFANNINTVVFEDFIEGQEFSVYAISDGFNISLVDFVTTKYNRFAYLGSNFFDEIQKNEIVEKYFKPLILSLAQEDCEYLGILGMDFVCSRQGDIFALDCNPFFESLDIELFTKSVEDDILDVFESVILGTFKEKYNKLKLKNKNYVSFINNSGEIETYEGRTLTEAINFSENEEVKEVFEWKF